jgi:hypothetical protein
MTPTVPELLVGCATALSSQPSAEDAGLYTATRLRTVATLNVLIAQECAVGSAVRVWENSALRLLLLGAAAKYGQEFAEAHSIDDGDCSLATLDQSNAELRRLVIRLHGAVEAAGDHKLDREILALYRVMAERRELKLPAARPAT